MTPSRVSFLTRIFAAVVVALGALVGGASADTLKLTSGTYSNGSGGGAYTVTFTGGTLSGPIDSSSYFGSSVASTTTFETFCLEPKEYFTSGGIYDYTVAKFAFGGGNDYHESDPFALGDILSKGTSWLYTQYASGALMGSLADAYSSDTAIRKAANLKLQKAFWYLEDDLPLPSSNPYLTAVITQFGTLALAQANAGANEYNVYALNLTSGSSSTNNLKQHQSQLYYHVPPRVPDSGATIGMIGLGLALLALQRRRLTQRV